MTLQLWSTVCSAFQNIKHCKNYNIFLSIYYIKFKTIWTITSSRTVVMCDNFRQLSVFKTPTSCNSQFSPSRWYVEWSPLLRDPTSPHLKPQLYVDTIEWRFLSNTNTKLQNLYKGIFDLMCLGIYLFTSINLDIISAQNIKRRILIQHGISSSAVRLVYLFVAFTKIISNIGIKPHILEESKSRLY